MRIAHRLEELLQEVEKGGSETSIERVLVKGFLREYHDATGEGRKALVEASPRRSGTVWDAVVAAAIEHACEMHDEPIPAWTQEPGRFLEEPWTACRLPISHATAFWNAPAAFIRHNTFIEPRNLDERTGEKHVWATDERTTPEPVRADERKATTSRPDGGGVHRGRGRDGASAPSDTRNPGRRLVDPGRARRGEGGREGDRGGRQPQRVLAERGSDDALPARGPGPPRAAAVRRIEPGDRRGVARADRASG